MKRVISFVVCLCLAVGMLAGCGAKEKDEKKEAEDITENEKGDLSLIHILTTFEANYAYAFAAMVISILPTIVIYAMLTDKIIGGMTAGAVKG